MLEPFRVQDPSPLSEQQQRQLGLFAASLMGPAEADQTQRLNAAQELILMRTPQATAVLAEALRSGQAPVILAVLDAMERQPQAVSGLLEPAVQALKTAPPAVHARLATAITRYGNPALQMIAAIAVDATIALDQRLGAITALGAFRSRESAASLIEILRQSPENASQLHDAACRALGNLTGLTYGNNVEAWIQWWLAARNQSPEQWLAEMVRNLQTQIATLTEANTALRSQVTATNDRLIQAYRDLFPALPESARLAMLPTLLEDPLSRVRMFAVERIRRLLRDSATIPAELQDKLAQRMTDEQADVRIAVAELLDSLGYAGLANRVAEALDREREAAVVAAYLNILKVRTSAQALNPLCYWLQDATHGPSAADALWAMLIGEYGTTEARQQARDVLRQTGTTIENPSMYRLLAFVGDEADRQALEPILDGDNPDHRRAVAEGFARAGHSRPLLDRTANVEIYPYAVLALSLSVRDVDGLRVLARLQPAPPNIALWEEAIVQVTARLPPDSILQADDVLSPLTYALPPLRSRVLGRVAMLPPSEIAQPLRIDVIGRWVPLLLELGEWRRAYETLETIPPAPGNTTLGRMKFRAALMIGQYDVAGQLDGTPSSWIAVLADIAPLDPQAAGRLRDEIARRFEPLLTGDVKTAFDAAANLIPPMPTPPSSAAGDAAAGG